jgi:pimeloyl-ACP methyl ester carboxylesterase
MSSSHPPGRLSSIALLRNVKYNGFDVLNIVHFMEGIGMSTVMSKDGTKIAYDKTGHGPAVIHVAGAMGTRSFGFPEHARLLESHFTVYTYDRRGRGESTDTRPFSVECEVEDIEALIHEAGGSAYLYGVSSGACLVLEAAIMLESKVKKLALYEAPYNSDPHDKPIWHDYYTKLHVLVAANKRGDAVVHFLKFVGVPDHVIEEMRTQPMWVGLEALAPTLLYDAAAMGGETRLVPVERVAKVGAPTLIMDGEKSLKIYPFMRTTADALAQAMPNAERRTLKGQGHDVDAHALAPELVEFFSESK